MPKTRHNNPRKTLRNCLLSKNNFSYSKSRRKLKFIDVSNKENTQERRTSIDKSVINSLKKRAECFKLDKRRYPPLESQFNNKESENLKIEGEEHENLLGNIELLSANNSKIGAETPIKSKDEKDEVKMELNYCLLAKKGKLNGKLKEKLLKETNDKAKTAISNYMKKLEVKNEKSSKTLNLESNNKDICLEYDEHNTIMTSATSKMNNTNSKNVKREVVYLKNRFFQKNC